MTPRRLGTLSLCASCGRDRAPSGEPCPCAGPDEGWQLVGAAPAGSMVDTRFGSIVFGGLVLSISLAIASAHSLAVLGTLLVAPSTALIVFFGGRRWRTDSGSQATTFLGIVVTADGRGTDRTPLPVVGYGRLRGDWVAASLEHGRGGTAQLGGDLAENAILSALLGAASRGSIVLWAEDAVHWTRSLRSRGITERDMHAAAVLIETTASFEADEDKLLGDLLHGVVAPGSDAGTYREPGGRRGRREAPLRLLLRGFRALGDPTDLSRRYRDEEGDATKRSRAAEIHEEVSRAGADLALRPALRALLHEIRHGSQSNIARALALVR